MDVNKLGKFMPVAHTFAAMSKDPSTKVGAVVLGPSFEVRATGWNGAPRGCKADVDDRYRSRDEKLWWVAHAEANAISNAARAGSSLEGCSILVTHPPCMSCAKLIVQAGIKVVMYPTPTPEFMERWLGDYARANELFRECGVDVYGVPE